MKLGFYSESIRGAKCRFCGATLNHRNVEYYDHDGGYEVEGFTQKQWLYVTCHKCGHQWSLVHLGVDRARGK